MEKRILAIFMMAWLVTLFSCVEEEVENPVVFKSTSAEFTVLDMDFVQDNGDDDYIRIKWNAVDFGPSKEVKYSVEVAKAGTNFDNPIDVATVSALADTLTVQELNLALVSLGFSFGEEASVDIRIRAWVDYLTDPGISNTISLTLTPYELVFPPIYVVGDFQGWDMPNAVVLTSNTPGVYKGVVNLAGGNFRFFKEQDWGAEQYGYSTFQGGTIPPEFAEAGDGDSNFTFVGEARPYEVTVSLTAVSITITPLGPPPPPSSIFLVTSQTIDINNAIEFPSAATGVYVNTIELPQNTKFRFFTEQKWNAEKWGWSYFDEAAIDSDLGDSGDDVSSFIFLSDESEYYTITVDVNEKSIVVEPSAPPFPEVLYVNGAPYSWSFDNAAILLSTDVGVYEGLIKVQTDGDGFRFFSTNDWVQPQYGYDYFVNSTIPAQFYDGGGGDHNFKHSDPERYYKVTVSLIDQTIEFSDPVLYIIGDDQGWNLGNAFALTWQSGGTFTGTTTFSNNSIFRFFVKPDWGLPGNEYNYASFTTVDAELTNGGGGDQNFLFGGTTGSHTITVDLLTSTVDIN